MQKRDFWFVMSAILKYKIKNLNQFIFYIQECKYSKDIEFKVAHPLI